MKNRPTESKQNLLPWMIAAILVLLASFIYLPVRNFEFLHYDDDLFVSENPHIQEGLSSRSIRWALAADLFQDSKNADYWIPATILSRIIDIQLFGLDPAGHHLMNLFFHLVNVVLLFHLLNRLTVQMVPSALAAALFAVHPLHIESVAWVTERKDVLSMLFWLATILAYSKYVQSRQSSKKLTSTCVRNYLLVCLFFALGLLSKPMVVTLPLILLLMDFWPFGRWQPGTPKALTSQVSTLVLEKVPLLALSLVSGLVTFIAQKRGGTVSSLESISLGTRLGNAAVSYVTYLYKMVWPQDLAVIYSYQKEFPGWKVLLAILFIVAISVLVIRFRKLPFLVFGWFYFLISLLPVIGIIQVGGQAMADRYTYIPLVGIYLIISLGAFLILKSRPRWAYFVFCGALLVPLIVVSKLHLPRWKNKKVLFEHAVKVTSRNYIAHMNLGNVHSAEGDLERAKHHYQTAIEIEPRFPETYNSLGVLLAREDQLDQAIPLFSEAVRLAPNFGEAHHNLASSLVRLRQFEEAEEEYRLAMKYLPDDPEVRNNLGLALARQGKLQEAIGYFQEALQLKPNYPEAHCNIGIALSEAGELSPAIQHLQEALRLNPDYEKARNTLARITSRK